MGLGITVGRLAYFLEDGYAEGVEEIERDMEVINRLLAENNLPQHTEPRTRPKMHSRSSLDHMAYGMFSQFQRALAYTFQKSKKLKPVREGAKSWEDPVFLAERKRFRSHLICHSVEGYFVTIDFPGPLQLNPSFGLLGGESLGSCQAAMRELIRLAPFIGITLRDGNLSDTAAEAINEERRESKPAPLWEERSAWLILFESFRLSIEHGLAVSFH